MATLFDNPITDFLGLTPDMSGAADAAQFNPYNINSSFGTLSYNPASRSFSTVSQPGLNLFRTNLEKQNQMGMPGIRMRQLPGLWDQQGSIYNTVSPQTELDLLRSQADPYNQAQYKNLESRLFKQGRLGASQEYDAGGAMRGLFDSQAQQDLAFQQQAIGNAMARENQAMQREGQLFDMSLQGGNYAMQKQTMQSMLENQLLQNYLASINPEMALMQAGQGFGGIGMQGQMAQSNIYAQDAAFTPNAIWSMLGGATSGFMMGKGAAGGGMFL